MVGLAALSRSEGLVLFVPLLVLPLALLTPEACSQPRAVCGATGRSGWLATLVVLAPWVGPSSLARFDHTEVLLSENLGGTLATSNCQQVYYGNLIGYWYYPCGQAILDKPPHRAVRLQRGRRS